MVYSNQISEISRIIPTEGKLGDQKQGSSILIQKAAPIVIIEATQDTIDNPMLTIQSNNLFSGEYEKGYLKYGEEKLYGYPSDQYKTTRWFPVLAAQGQSLVLSGDAHNRSTWQFQTAEGKILTEVGLPQKYRVPSDVMQDKTVSKVDLPENAAFARVYYAHLKDGSLGERLQIEYGKLPTYYQPYQWKQIVLPKLKQGESLVYNKGVWTQLTNNQNMVLPINTPELQPGITVSIHHSSCSLKVSYEPDIKDKTDTGCYGVRWSRKDSLPICERIGDAKGLTFNALYQGTKLTPYENSFDHIYPWSELKLCNIKTSKANRYRVIYQEDKEFRLDGSQGNVMVEIPKFYCKREVIEDYEYLWISSSMKEGYSLDPSFVTDQGILDHIYIGAYLSRIKNKRLVSTSDSYPMIRKSFQEIQKLVHNSKGFQECDLLAILTIQKLFLVETALLDSQSLYAGNVYLPYLLKNKSSSMYAITSESATNHIQVKDTQVTRRFCVGDAVSILSSWKEFKNQPGVFQREVTQIKDLGNETLEITFSGEPIDILEGESGITCIPCKNGITDQIPYVTGGIGELTGHSSFKYRGIENLWGNVWIFLDHVRIKNSEIFVTYPTGVTNKIGYQVPEQKVELFPQKFGNPEHMIIKQMGYDGVNPFIMLPSEIGNGATTYGYYCDAWYNLAEENISYVLTYGGAWDNKGYAGIFNYRASFTEVDKIPYNGSRLMLRITERVNKINKNKITATNKDK